MSDAAANVSCIMQIFDLSNQNSSVGILPKNFGAASSSNFLMSLSSSLNSNRNVLLQVYLVNTTLYSNDAMVAIGFAFAMASQLVPGSGNVQGSDPNTATSAAIIVGILFAFGTAGFLIYIAANRKAQQYATKQPLLQEEDESGYINLNENERKSSLQFQNHKL